MCCVDACTIQLLSAAQCWTGLVSDKQIMEYSAELLRTRTSYNDHTTLRTPGHRNTPEHGHRHHHSYYHVIKTPVSVSEMLTVK